MGRTPSRPVPATLDIPGLYRFSVAQLHAMLDAGILLNGEPCELLEGLIVNHPRPLSPRAGGARTRVHEEFSALPLDGWFSHLIPPIAMAESEPEPDFAVIRGTIDTHKDRHPAADEVGVIGEVSETSLDFDRREKGRIYAAAGIPVYWIVNVDDRQVEVYADPDPAAAPPAYRTRTDYRPGADVPVDPGGAAVAAVPAADLLP